MTDNGRTTSVWMQTSEMPVEPPLPSDLRADVCIVGAGIAGLTTAYLLTKEGQTVIVLDDGPTAGGETCRTTAHLVTALDDRFYDLEELHGHDGSRLAAESHASAIDTIERIVRDEAIACDFSRLDGYLFVPPGENPEQLKRELASRASGGTLGPRPGRSRPDQLIRYWTCASFPAPSAVSYPQVPEWCRRGCQAWRGTNL